ncbi:MAG: 50S ribosomal protein L5 [Candidatus Hodgkinia cicadicola]
MFRKVSVTFERLLQLQSTLICELKVKNIHQVPKINKAVVYSGLNYKQTNVSDLRLCVKLDLQLITGSKVAYSKAKTTIANFNIKRGDTIGYKVTLRGVRLYSFLDKLIAVALPKAKSFCGLKLKSFDYNNNITFGLSDYSVFSEETNSVVASPLGMNVTLHLEAKCLGHSVLLLQAIGFNVYE